MGININAKSEVRKAKNIINQQDVDYILSLSSEDCAKKSTIMNLFADFGNGPKFQTYDIISIPPNSYGKKKKNKKAFTTTIGLYIYNKGSLEEFSDILGYINEPITDDVYGDINQTLSYALLEDKITVEQLKDFIMQSQIYMSCTSAICPSHTMKMLLVTNEVEKEKKKLEKKYKEGLEKKDIRAATDMNKELLDYAKNYIGDDPSADMYNSGARSSWNNNFKNMYVMKGAVKLTDGSYDIIESSYISGMDKKDFASMNDSAVGGPYSRAVNTSIGGYKEKLVLGATQHLKVGPKGSDCGTTNHIVVTLTKKNIKDWIYSFVIGNNGRLTEITSENMNSFIGKTVKMRFSGMCKSARNGIICEKCASSRFNRIGITNIGLTTSIMMSSLKNASMKKFHDSTLNLYEINPDEFFDLK